MTNGSYEANDQISRVVAPLRGRKVKAIYVKRAVELIDRLFPESSESDEIESSEDDE